MSKEFGKLVPVPPHEQRLEPSTPNAFFDVAIVARRIATVAGRTAITETIYQQYPKGTPLRHIKSVKYRETDEQ
jgi:hypothetical protein